MYYSVHYILHNVKFGPCYPVNKVIEHLDNNVYIYIEPMIELMHAIVWSTKVWFAFLPFIKGVSPMVGSAVQ